MAHPFEQELARLINKHSMENGSDTPDFILAQFLTGVLQVWNAAVMRREDWYTENEAADDLEQEIATPSSDTSRLADATLPELDRMRAEIKQARQMFRAECRAILWRSLENVDGFADAIGDVSIHDAFRGWVEDLMAQIAASLEEETPSGSQPS